MQHCKFLLAAQMGITLSAQQRGFYRLKEFSDISAELLAASASCADICAVCAGVPQLGASLPSPQARGR